MPRRDGKSSRRGAGVALPALDPSAAFGFSEQLQGLYGQTQSTLGALKTQRALIKGAFTNQRAAILRSRQSGLAEAEGAAIDRGVLGSTGDFKARSAVRANAASQLAEAMNARAQALLANRTAQMQANSDLQMGVYNIEAQQAAMQSAQAAQDLLINGFLAPDTTENFNDGPGATGGGTKLSPAEKDRIKDLTQGIKDSIARYADAGPYAQVNILHQLNQAWKQRNRVRAKYGLAPIPKRRLERLIAAAEGGSGLGKKK